MTRATRSKIWLTAAVALLAVVWALTLTAAPSQANCPNGEKVCHCPVGSKTCHCPPSHPRTGVYCEFCNPGTVYDPNTKTCHKQCPAGTVYNPKTGTCKHKRPPPPPKKHCKNPRTGHIIKYPPGHKKPLLCFRPPKAITGSSHAHHIRRHSAVITGVVLDPHHFKTRWFFLWGKCPNLNHRTKGGYVYKRTHVSATLHHLHPGTVYCYRLVAKNKRGTALGAVKRFRTKISQRPKKPHGFTG